MGNPSGQDWISQRMMQWETLGLLGEEGNLGQDAVTKRVDLRGGRARDVGFGSNVEAETKD